MSSAYRGLYPERSGLDRKQGLAFGCYVVDIASKALGKRQAIADFLDTGWRFLAGQVPQSVVEAKAEENADATPDLDDPQTHSEDYWVWFSAGSALEACTVDSRELDAADECLAAFFAGEYSGEEEDTDPEMVNLQPRLREEYNHHMRLLSRLASYGGPFTLEALAKLAE